MAPQQRPVTKTTPALARAIAVTSGKGGVGKSNIAVNIAVSLSGLGLRVVLLDADLGLANADVLCSLTPRQTLDHVVAGRCRLRDVALAAPGGFRLIPGASGVARIADLAPRQRAELLRQLGALEQVADVILIDTGAGISENVLTFAGAAHTVLVVTTPEPTAMTDAYGMIKTLVGFCPHSDAKLVVNMAQNREEADDVHARISRVSGSFLGRRPALAGVIPADPAVPSAVRLRLPFSLSFPDAPATAAVRGIARELVGLEPDRRADDGGFMSRLLNRIGIRTNPSSDG
jgi:flagellar biosynthesis protein FlhG